MALYLYNLLSKIQVAKPTITRKRTRSEFEEDENIAPPAKIQKALEEPVPENSYEEDEIIFETIEEHDLRKKDEEIQKLKSKNKKLKKSNEDKDAIIKMLTQQLAEASKKSGAKFNIEVPLNFGVLNCGN